MDRYRRLTLPIRDRMKAVVEEHHAVLAAIEAHDEGLAAAKMDEHLKKLQMDISTFTKAYHDYFLIDYDIDQDFFRDFTT